MKYKIAKSETTNVRSRRSCMHIKRCGCRRCCKAYEINEWKIQLSYLFLFIQFFFMQVAVVLSVCSACACLLRTYSRCSLDATVLTSPNRVVGLLRCSMDRWLGVCVLWARTYPALTAMTAMIGTAWNGENLIKMIWFSSHFLFALNSHSNNKKTNESLNRKS